MKKLIVLVMSLTLLALSVQAATNLYFSINLNYNSGKLSKGDVKLLQSNEILNLTKTSGEYKLVLKSFNEDILFETYFDVNKQIATAPLKEWFDKDGNQINSSTEAIDIELKNTVISVFIPFFKNAKSIDVYNKNNELQISIDVSDYATCNMNHICDLKETHELCPEDCPNSEKMIKLNLWQRIINFIKNLFK